MVLLPYESIRYGVSINNDLLAYLSFLETAISLFSIFNIELNLLSKTLDFYCYTNTLNKFCQQELLL